MKKTSLPSVPVCQPVTETVNPSFETVYQLIKELSANTRPPIQASSSPGARSAAGGRPGLGRSNLDPEGRLDLFPDRQGEEDRDEEEDAEKGEETDARAAELAFVLDTRAPASPSVRERARNRRWVDRRVFDWGTRGGGGADESRLLPLCRMTASEAGTAWG